jgi:hypothetical protein
LVGATVDRYTPPRSMPTSNSIWHTHAHNTHAICQLSPYDSVTHRHERSMNIPRACGLAKHAETRHPVPDPHENPLVPSPPHISFLSEYTLTHTLTLDYISRCGNAGRGPRERERERAIASHGAQGPMYMLLRPTTSLSLSLPLSDV